MGRAPPPFLVAPLAARDRKNFELFTVLGNRAASDLDVLLGEDVGDRLIAQAVVLVFFVNDLAETVFDVNGRQVLTLIGL